MFLDNDMEEEDGENRYATGSTSAGAFNESNGNWLRFMEYGDSSSNHTSNSSSTRKVLSMRQRLNHNKTRGGNGLDSSTTNPTQGPASGRDATEEDMDKFNEYRMEEGEEREGESTALSKVDRIEQSFRHSTPVHYEKPELVAECVWEVFPDELNCCFDFGLVVG